MSIDLGPVGPTGYTGLEGPVGEVFIMPEYDYSIPGSCPHCGAVERRTVLGAVICSGCRKTLEE